MSKTVNSGLSGLAGPQPAIAAPDTGLTAASPCRTTPETCAKSPPITSFVPSGENSIVRTEPFVISGCELAPSTGGAQGSRDPSEPKAARLVRGAPDALENRPPT